MLYERWRQVARDRAGEWALMDGRSGQRWTFGQLETLRRPCRGTALSHPRGKGPEFVFELLAGWREGKVVCPLEADMTEPEWQEVPPQVAHIKFTSASTGMPRGILVSASQLYSDAANIMTTMGLRPDWPNVGVLSMAHSYGFSNLVLPLLLHGIPLVLADSPLPESLRLAAGRVEAVTLPAVPALWRAWHEAGAIPGNVRLAISAGAPLPLALETAIFEARGLKLHNFLGSSECGGIAYDGTKRPRLDEACVGSALANVALSIGEDGCLEVRGSAVAEGYWPEPEDRLADGIFRTRDLVSLRDGLVYWEGRAGDMMNVAGRKLAPEAVERALMGVTGVVDCLVFGVPRTVQERGDEVVGCVVLARDVSEQEMRSRIQEHLPAWQIPKRWWVLDSLEANPRGKRSRTEWRQLYLERTGTKAGEESLARGRRLR